MPGKTKKGNVVGAVDIAAIRTAVADYMESEGCSCCQDVNAHKQHEKVLAKMLRVKAYSDKSGYDFRRYRTSPKGRKKNDAKKEKE